MIDSKTPTQLQMDLKCEKLVPRGKHNPDRPCQKPRPPLGWWILDSQRLCTMHLNRICKERGIDPKSITSSTPRKPTNRKLKTVESSNKESLIANKDINAKPSTRLIDDVWHIVVGMLEYKELLVMSMVSWGMRELARECITWKLDTDEKEAFFVKNQWVRRVSGLDGRHIHRDRDPIDLQPFWGHNALVDALKARDNLISIGTKLNITITPAVLKHILDHNRKLQALEIYNHVLGPKIDLCNIAPPNCQLRYLKIACCKSAEVVSQFPNLESLVVRDALAPSMLRDAPTTLKSIMCTSLLSFVPEDDYFKHLETFSVGQIVHGHASRIEDWVKFGEFVARSPCLNDVHIFRAGVNLSLHIFREENHREVVALTLAIRLHTNLFALCFVRGHDEVRLIIPRPGMPAINPPDQSWKEVTMANKLNHDLPDGGDGFEGFTETDLENHEDYAYEMSAL